MRGIIVICTYGLQLLAVFLFVSFVVCVVDTIFNNKRTLYAVTYKFK